MTKLLEIKDIFVTTNEKEIIKGLSLCVNAGETHVIMGPNGAGKTTLGNVILRNPAFKLERGDIKFLGKDLSNLSTDKVAQMGVFMSFQQPVEIEGISTYNFLRTVKNARGDKTSAMDLRRELTQTAEKLDMPEKLLSRDLNVGFSGGEKKKNEILQMLSLKPKLAILDETDSGLDVDAIRTVAKGIKMFRNSENAVIVITHSSKILEYLDVDFVHILVDGRIVCTGGPELVAQIEREGYNAFKGGEKCQK